jgi:hypothetical protein
VASLATNIGIGGKRMSRLENVKCSYKPER